MIIEHSGSSVFKLDDNGEMVKEIREALTAADPEWEICQITDSYRSDSDVKDVVILLEDDGTHIKTFGF